MKTEHNVSTYPWFAEMYVANNYSADLVEQLPLMLCLSAQFGFYGP